MTEDGRILPYPTPRFKDLYEPLRFLGSGTYGTVWLCIERPAVEGRGSATASPPDPAQGSNYLTTYHPLTPGMPFSPEELSADDGIVSCTGTAFGLRRSRRSGNYKEAAAAVFKDGDLRVHPESPKGAGIPRFSQGRESAKRGVTAQAGRRGKQYACKVVKKKALNSTSKRDDLRREVAVLKAFSGQHENIIRLHEVTESASEVRLIMEHCRGGDLFQLLCSQGKLPEAAAKFLFKQLAEALSFCHSHGVLHRDIKPENILFDRPALGLYSMCSASDPPPAVTAKLIDFGLSVVIGEGDTTEGYTGSRYYTAPEMVSGMDYGMRADVWSLGIVLHAMLTARLPFAGVDDDDYSGIQSSILKGELDFGLPFWEGVSDSAKDLVRAMLEVDPSKRLRSEELLAHRWLTEDRPRGDGGSGEKVPSWPLYFTRSSTGSEGSCISQETTDADSPSPTEQPEKGFTAHSEGVEESPLKEHDRDEGKCSKGQLMTRMQHPIWFRLGRKEADAFRQQRARKVHTAAQ